MAINRAYDQPAPTIHPRLTEHSKKMEQQVYQVTDNYYLAYGYGIASTHMIVGTDGIVIIDPVECVMKCREIDKAFRRITNKPVRAVIYTHMHGDHLFGVKWRNWYLTSARELEGERFGERERVGIGFSQALPPASKVESFCFLLVPKKSMDVHLTVVFHFEDLNQKHALEVRRGIAQFHSVPPEHLDLTITIDDHFLAEMAFGMASTKEGLETGKIKVDGDMDSFTTFFNCFESHRGHNEIFLTLR